MAKAVCAGCQVRRECLQYALATRQLHGVWGGTTEDNARLHVRRENERGQDGRGAMARPARAGRSGSGTRGRGTRIHSA